MLTLILAGLCGLQQDDGIPALLEKLRSDKAEEREDAQGRLKNLGSKAVPHLERAAKDADPELRNRAEHLLRVISIAGRLTPALRQAVPGIEERLATNDDHAWTEMFFRAAIKLREAQENPGNVQLPLGEADLKALVLPAFRASLNKDERKRVLVLVKIRVLVSAIPEVRVLLSDDDPEVKVACIEALNNLDAQDAYGQIAELLKDPDPRIKLAALQALGTIGPPEAVSRLMPFLEDKNEDLRVWAMIGLGTRRAKDAVPALLRCLNDKDPHIRREANNALKEIDPQEALKALPRLLQDEHYSVRLSAVRSMVELTGKAAIPRLKALLDDDSAYVESEVVRYLVELEGREAIPDLVKALKSLRKDVQKEVAIVLCQWGVKEGVPVILEQAETPWLLNGVRKPAVWARLANLRSTAKREESRGAMLTRIAREAGMTLEFPKGTTGLEATWTSPVTWFPYVTCLRGLLWAVDDASFEIVLEDASIRVLPSDKATEFWKAWWEEEKKK